MELKIREPLTVILLSVVTCGIYFLYWTWQTNKTINYLTGKEHVPGGIVILGFFCGFVDWYIWYKWDLALTQTARQRGLAYSSNFILWVILSVLAGIGGLFMIFQVQDAVNRLIEQGGQPNAQY